MKSICKLYYRSSKQDEVLKLIQNCYQSINSRKLVAQNPECTRLLLNELSKDSDMGIRYWVAQNPNTSIPTLVRLWADSFWNHYDYVRTGLLKNPNWIKYKTGAK